MSVTVDVDAGGAVTVDVDENAGGPAGGVLSGNYPDPGFAVPMATEADLTAHEAAHPAHPASGVSVASGAGVTATDVQAAIAQIVGFITSQEAGDSAAVAAVAAGLADETTRATAQELLKLVKAANLSDLADAATARTNLGLGSAATHPATDFDAAGAAAAAQAASQPLDSDLTAIAALTTTVFGRALLALADAAAGRTALGLGSAATQPSSAFDPAGAATAAAAALVNSSPATLDTLKELADALGDDPNFATTTATALGTKVDTAGAGLVKTGTTMRRAASTTGYANLAALPTASAHTGEQIRTTDGGIYESDGASWLVIRDPSGTYASAPLQRSIVWPGKGRGVTVDRVNDYFVCGINLGIGPSTINTNTAWTTAWDWAGWTQPKLDKIAKLGANAVRVQGNATAYLANPSQYLSRFQQTMEYCRSLGLRVLYCFFNGVDDAGIASANRTTYAAMATALAGPYAGDKLMLGWDIGNELPVGTADILTLATNFATDLRAVDPTTKITCSIAGTPSGMQTSVITTVDSIVDFHDVHIYAEPGNDSFHPNWLDDIRANTSKPFVIAEFGANNNASAAAGPHIPDEYQVAQYLRAVRRYAYGGDVMGFMVWQLQDDNTSSQWGLYDGSGNPRQALAEWLRFPDKRQDAAVDALLYRSSPVVLDDFKRANSAASVGTSPLGGAPTAGAGTWGISSKKAYVATGVSGHNLLVWETNTADGEFEMEFLRSGSSYYNVGLIYRYVDSTHWCLLQANLTSGGQVTLYENNGGSFTNVFQTALTAYYVGRLRVVLRDQVVFCYFGDRLITRQTGRSFQSTATKHGLYRWDGGTPDVGSTFTRFSSKLQIRGY